MKIFNVAQIKEWDALSIKLKEINSLELMESASVAFVSKFKTKFSISSPVAVVCGTGNNGGDGLAIARILDNDGYDVKIWLADFGQKKSPDFSENLNRLPGFGHIPLQTIDMAEPPVFEPNSVIIDAIFGTGLNTELDGKFEDLVLWLNSLQHIIVSVDIPSGMFADRHTNIAIEADYTYTFQTPKLSFFLPCYEKFTGKVVTIDIGLVPEYNAKAFTPFYLIESDLIKQLIYKREKFSHKGVFGHALLINGSYGKAGASILSSKACLRSGVGLLTNHLPVNLYPILQMAVPEAMASIDQHNYYWSTLPENIRRYSAIGVGCGIDQKESTVRIFKSLLQEYDGRMVLDADALNIIANNKDLLTHIPGGSILTPHLKEFERLFGNSKNCFDRLELLRENAKKYSVTIILKGAHSQIAMSDGTVYFNCSGNPGMATAGSGDVLTGIITAFLAQGYDTDTAAIIGTYIHGLAGDFAYEGQSYESMIASDLVENLGKAFHTLFE